METQETAITDKSHKTGRRPASRPDLEGQAADRALYERLQRDDFAGREMDLLREGLWIYGWKCLRAWITDGTIIEKCGERGLAVEARYFEVELLRRRADIRDELAHEAVQEALRTFTENFLPQGAWDPDRGATMRTFFIGTCLYAFRDHYNSWAYRYRRDLFRAAAPVNKLDDTVEHPEDALVLNDTIQRILTGAGPEIRAICGLIWESKATQKDIGAELGMTSRAVEGHMRRLRARAKRMVARGEIEALYARLAPEKASRR